MLQWELWFDVLQKVGNDSELITLNSLPILNVLYPHRKERE
nr:MAG TPA: hypothetical protein [Caudoviricetes sp.]